MVYLKRFFKNYIKPKQKSNRKNTIKIIQIYLLNNKVQIYRKKKNKIYKLKN